MTAPEFQQIRAALGLTKPNIAECLGVGLRTVQQWEAADRAIPEPVARILRLALAEPAILDRFRAA